MTKYIFGILLIWSISSSANEKTNHKSCDLNFTAPLVFDVNTASPVEVGQIAYDTQDDEFKGYKNDGSWTTLSRAPTFISQTSDTRAGSIAAAYLSLVNNSVTLTPGSWVLNGNIQCLRRAFRH